MSNSTTSYTYCGSCHYYELCTNAEHPGGRYRICTNPRSSRLSVVCTDKSCDLWRRRDNIDLRIEHLKEKHYE